MARYRLPKAFSDQYLCNYVFITSPDPEAECFICKTPYAPNDPDGCRPIKLIPCGHIIGHECFLEWTSRFPRVCPYWSHHLPRIPKAWASNKNREGMILRSLVESVWITAMDDFIQHLVSRVKEGKQRRAKRRAIKALATGKLTRKKVNVLTKWVAYLVFREAFMLGFVKLAVPVAGIVCCLQLCLCISGYHGFHQVLRNGMCTTISYFWLSTVLHACAYCVIMRRVLVLRLRRNAVKKNGVVGPPE